MTSVEPQPWRGVLGISEAARRRSLLAVAKEIKQSNLDSYGGAEVSSHDELVLRTEVLTTNLDELVLKLRFGLSCAQGCGASAQTFAEA